MLFLPFLPITAVLASESLFMRTVTLLLMPDLSNGKKKETSGKYMPDADRFFIAIESIVL